MSDFTQDNKSDSPDYAARAREVAGGEDRFNTLVEIANQAMQHVGAVMELLRGEQAAHTATAHRLGEVSVRLAELEERIRAAQIEVKTGFLTEDAFRDRQRALDRTIAASRGAEQRGVPPVFTMVFMDFDGFGAINHVMTEIVADRLLAILGAKVRGVIRNEDVPYRWGGDEAVVYMPGIAVNSRRDRAELKARLDKAGKDALAEYIAELEASGKTEQAAKLRTLRGGGGYSVGIASYTGTLPDSKAVLLQANLDKSATKARRKRRLGMDPADKNYLS